MRREGTSATVVPGPGHVTYECKFIDQIARNSLCCAVVSSDLLRYEEGLCLSGQVDGEVIRGTCTFAVA
jgi:hypothetical protein